MSDLDVKSVDVSEVSDAESNVSQKQPTISMEILNKTIHNFINNGEVIPVTLLEKLTPDQLKHVEETVDPFNYNLDNVEKKEDQFVSYSFVDINKRFQERLITTAMIGFLHRMCDSYMIPKNMRIITAEEYVLDPSSVEKYLSTIKHEDNPDIIKDINQYRDTMNKRLIVKEFLNNVFSYNPDKHVSSSYKLNIYDNDREMLNTPAAELSIIEEKKRNPAFREAVFLAKRKQLINNDLQKIRSQIENESSSESQSTTFSIAKDKEFKYNNRKILFSDPEMKLLQMNKGDNEVTVSSTDRKNILTKLYGAPDIPEYETIPPTDIFYRINNYLTKNYDDLIEITENLYAEKHDISNVINIISVHDTEADLFESLEKNKTKFITKVHTGKIGKWNVFGDYKSVVKQIKYSSTDTKVLNEMYKEIEESSKMGQRIVDNRIKINRKNNVLKYGEQDESFKKYQEENNLLERDYNMQRANKTEEKKSHDTPNTFDESEHNELLNLMNVNVLRFTDGVLETDTIFTNMHNSA